MQTIMKPRELVQRWVDAFNRADCDTLASFYADDAVNHQVAEAPVQGRTAIRGMFATGFASANMVCIVENIFEDGEWAIVEWKDPLGLRGCGFFHIAGDRIVFQRGYWDKLSLPAATGITATQRMTVPLFPAHCRPMPVGHEIFLLSVSKRPEPARLPHA